MRAIDPTAPPDIGSVLIHGLNNTGKTHLLGSMLVCEKQYGKVVYIGMQGEPNATIYAHDLEGVELVEVETVDDIPKLATSLGHVHAIALDSVQRLGELASDKVTGSKYIIGSKVDHGRDWLTVKGEIFRALMHLQRITDLFVAVCPSNLHENQITHQVRVIPDVPGVGEKLLGRFNFVGYIEATTLSPTAVSRIVGFQPRLDVVTRCNAPKVLLKPLNIEKDGWKTIAIALEEALDAKTQPRK